MLGRLEMDLEECDEAYDTISQQLFGHKRFFMQTPGIAMVSGSYVYQAEPLEKAVKELVRRHLKDSTGNTRLQEPDHGVTRDRCKVLVTSIAELPP